VNDFEKQWLNKLSASLKKISREDIFQKMMANRKDLSSLEWSRQLMEELKRELLPDEIADVMTGCACLYPSENLTYLQKEYAETRDIKSVHAKLQDQFEKFIREYKKLTDEDIEFLIKNGWGMAGKLEEGRIIATKIPKQYHEYFQAENGREKAYYYCHCPRIREALKVQDKPIDMNYCYCGAGFYRAIWEYILQRSVRVEVVESIMKGDEVCKIAVYY
jgi:hypothetical protein